MGYEPEPLPSYRELRNISHTIKFKLHLPPGYSSLLTTSWYHHIISRLDPVICSDPVQSSYIGRQVTCYKMGDFRLWIYSLIGQISAPPRASSTRGYSHSLSSARREVIPAILQDDWWWKLYKDFSITLVTTQLSLPYSSTVCATAL